MSARVTAGREAPLREMPRVRQRPDEPGRRRWFSCPSADLFVWEDGGGIARFELCYGKPNAEHMLAWAPESGLRHAAVDDGEDHVGRNRTPIVVPDGRFDPDAVALEFERVGSIVEPRIYRLVLARLHGIGRSPPGGRVSPRLPWSPPMTPGHR